MKVVKTCPGLAMDELWDVAVALTPRSRHYPRIQLAMRAIVDLVGPRTSVGRALSLYAADLAERAKKARRRK